jgi:hypothetical protein
MATVTVWLLTDLWWIQNWPIASAIDKNYSSLPWQTWSIDQSINDMQHITESYTEKTTNLSHVTDKLYHIRLYILPWSRFELTTSVVIGTDCIGSRLIQLPYDLTNFFLTSLILITPLVSTNSSFIKKKANW